jgi:death on curing protein
MSETLQPIWLLPDVVYAAHKRQLAEHGGAEGVRDKRLLDSALDRPRNLFAYGDPPPDIFALAAAYAFGIARNHPFIDGNKRAAHIAYRLFLELNGWSLHAEDGDMYLRMIAIADGSADEQEFAQWLRDNCRPVTP